MLRFGSSWLRPLGRINPGAIGWRAGLGGSVPVGMGPFETGRVQAVWFSAFFLYCSGLVRNLISITRRSSSFAALTGTFAATLLRPLSTALGVIMKSKYWLIYLAFYLAFDIWSLLKLNEFNEPHSFSITDIFYIIIFVSILGLIFQKKIINELFWRIISWVSIIFIIHTWVIMPMIYLDDNIEWRAVGFIQLFAIPSLPLFIGLYIYAWRSREIWKSPNK